MYKTHKISSHTQWQVATLNCKRFTIILKSVDISQDPPREVSLSFKSMFFFPFFFLFAKTQNTRLCSAQLYLSFRITMNEEKIKNVH